MAGYQLRNRRTLIADYCRASDGDATYCPHMVPTNTRIRTP
ncbi:hypothetical protein [Acaryochloris marina]|nr:hypothetical protein [Acaryochloris marina]